MQAIAKQADGHTWVPSYPRMPPDVAPHGFDISNGKIVEKVEWMGEWCYVKYEDKRWYVKTRNLAFEEKDEELRVIRYFLKNADWFKFSGAIKHDVDKTQFLVKEIEKNKWAEAEGETVKVPEFVSMETRRWNEYIPDFKRYHEDRRQCDCR